MQLLLFRVIFFFLFFARSYWAPLSRYRFKCAVRKVFARANSTAPNPPSPSGCNRSGSEVARWAAFGGLCCGGKKPSRFTPPRLSGPHESSSALRNSPSCSSIDKYISPSVCLSAYFSSRPAAVAPCCCSAFHHPIMHH